MKRIVAITLGVAIFSILMGLREAVVGFYPRTGIAALAGACFAVTLIITIRKTPNTK